MDKVVVIGGGGFVGSHTADELTHQGYKVVILDRHASKWVKPEQEMVVGDMLDRNLLLELLDGAKYLYHFGGIADIGESQERPYETVHVNVMGATTALDVAVSVGIERFIYASTMYVYSNYGSFYRASKQAAEVIIEAYHERYGIEYTLLRYGSLYGSRAQRWNGIRRYIHQILQKKTLEFSGTGMERREYIHVKDAARLSVEILNEIHKNQAIIVTGQQTLNFQELTQMIYEIAGIDGVTTYLEKGSDHYSLTPYRYTPKSAKKLVPSEFIDIGQGILEVVEEIYQEME